MSPSAQSVQLPIVQVTVLEDRAQIARRGPIEVPAGSSWIQVEVAPTLVDKSLAAAISGGGSRGRVALVRVERRPRSLEEDRPKQLQKAEAALEQLQGESLQLSQELQLLNERAQFFSLASEQLLSDVMVDASFGRSPELALENELVNLADAERGALVSACDLKAKIQRLEEEERDLLGRIQLLKQPGQEVSAWAEIELFAEQSGILEISLDYLVPGACWRPCYTAELREPGTPGADPDAGAAPRVILHGEACVWQTTGEDWPAVKLVVSTERPSLGTEPPQLADEWLTAWRRGPVILEAREQRIESTGPGLGTESVLPGVDDGGEVRRLSPRVAASVPADGRPHRVELFQFSSPAELELLAIPELIPAVILKSTQQALGSFPLLAGPVDLIRRGGLVGRTELLYVAPGERFELGWGPDPALRLVRRSSILKTETTLLSSWSTTPHRVELSLSNLGAEARVFQLLERVPVSEVAEVKIEVDTKESSPAWVGPDAQGFLRGSVELLGHGTQMLALQYEIKKHPDAASLG